MYVYFYINIIYIRMSLYIEYRGDVYDDVSNQLALVCTLVVDRLSLAFISQGTQTVTVEAELIDDPKR
jgi:hypothetical protein